jgi:hypothetical protein
MGSQFLPKLPFFLPTRDDGETQSDTVEDSRHHNPGASISRHTRCSSTLIEDLAHAISELI